MTRINIGSLGGRVIKIDFPRGFGDCHLVLCVEGHTAAAISCKAASNGLKVRLAKPVRQRADADGLVFHYSRRMP